MASAGVAAGRKRKCPESPSSPGSSGLVFLNFRGTDTRLDFTDLLYTRLDCAGIRVFRDDKSLRAGDEIKQGLRDAIKQSRISIAIFSKNYASSKYCLMELEKMWECRELYGQTIIPIFYDVTPYAVKNQEEDFAESFADHEADSTLDANTIKKWKEVLRRVGELSGFERAKINGGRLSDLLEGVLKRVREELNEDDQDVPDELVGIDLHVQNVMRKLDVVFSNGQAIKEVGGGVRVVGICGMSGVGKTTLAKVVFNKIRKFFDKCCFLEDINASRGEVSLGRLIAYLQKENPEPSGSSGKRIKTRMENLFTDRKVLIVLDDVHEDEQIKALRGGEVLTWFAPGSRIIVTTDNRRVLEVFDYELVEECKVEPMSHPHALELFRRHAFRGDAPQVVAEYDALSPDFVEALGRLPMAICVVANYLRNNMEIKRWESQLKSLQKCASDDKVEFAFKSSYESLDPSAKQIFLDIACFFIGKDERILPYMWAEVWDADPLEKLQNLRDMHFLEDGENNKLRMHGMWRDFGRKRVKEKVLHERCRIWNRSDAISILRDGQGTLSVQGIGLTVEDGGTDSYKCEQFWKMSNLRYLRLDRAKIQGDATKLPQNLRWLDWRECPSIPELCKKHLKELAILDLSWSPVTWVSKFWKQIEEEDTLKVLNLHGCVQLQPSLNFPVPTELEMLIMEDCSRLCQIKPFNNLTKLTSLNLRNCSGITKLPQELYDMKLLTELLIDGTRIENIYCQEGSLKSLETLSARKCTRLRNISTISRLRKLSSLDLEGAAIDELPYDFEFPQKLKRLSFRECRKLDRLPRSIGKLDQLEAIDLSYTAIIELPESVENLSKLKALKMEGTFLQKFPKDIVKLKSLEEIDFSFCINLDGQVACDISGLSSLRILRLSSSKVAGLPQSICHLSSLQTLEVLKCSQLQALPKLPSSLLSLCWGSKIIEVPELAYLKNLKELCLKELCWNDDEQPEAGSSNQTPDIGWITRLPSLETLELSLPNVPNLPGNFSDLTELRELSLSYMKELDLTQLPSRSLLTLRLKSCKFQEPNFSRLRCLSELELKNCDLAEIGGLEELKLLEVLKISRCSSLTRLLGLTEVRRLRKLELLSSPLEDLPPLPEGVVDRCD